MFPRRDPADPVAKGTPIAEASLKQRSTEGSLEIEEQKQAAADVLYQYSQFVGVCVGVGVRPPDLRLHLMKEISGMPTSLYEELPVASTSPKSTGEPSSSGTMKDDKTEST